MLSTLFREKVSKLKDYRMKTETEFDVGYSTGFLNFDFKNGTVIHVKTEDKDFKYYSIGITDGSMVMVIGRSGCGKTTFILQAAANIIRPFKTSCIFFDEIEAGATTARKEMLTKFYGEEFKNRVISRNSGITAENFFERVKMIYDLKMENRSDYEYDTGLYDTSGNRIYKLEPTVYMLDSLALLMPATYTEEDELSGQMAATATAKANAAIFKRIIPMLKSANIILFVINHILEEVNINPMQRTKSQVSYLKQGEKLPGGKTPIYLCNTMIRFDDNSKLKESEAFGIDGALVDLGLVKSRTSKAGKSATLVFDQANGYDPELSLFVLLKENNRIGGAGAYLYIGDHSEIKFAQRNFKQKLRENPELQKIFMEEVMDVLKGSLTAEEEQERQSDFDISAMIMNNINNLTV